MPYDDNNVFAKILRGEIASERVYEDGDMIVIADIAPVAPHHLLVLPKEAIGSLADAGERHALLLGKMLLRVAELARELGVDKKGYRVVINTHDEGGQTVSHLHIHLLAGRMMGWPPG